MSFLIIWRALASLGAAAFVVAPIQVATAQQDSTRQVPATRPPATTQLTIAAVMPPATPVVRAGPRVELRAPMVRTETRQQADAPRTSTADAIDRRALATGAYYAFLGGAVAANAMGHFIEDPGGYPKQWDQWTVFHLIGGWSLDALGEKLAVPVTYKRIPVRPLAVCSTIIAWEQVKGHADWRDMAAGCTGAAVSAGSTWLFRALF